MSNSLAINCDPSCPSHHSLTTGCTPSPAGLTFGSALTAAYCTWRVKRIQFMSVNMDQVTKATSHGGSQASGTRVNGTSQHDVTASGDIAQFYIECGR